MAITAPSIAFQALVTSTAQNTNYGILTTEINRIGAPVDAAVSTAGVATIFKRDGAGGGQLSYAQIIGSAATIAASTLLVRAAAGQANAQRVATFQNSAGAEVGYVDPSGNAYLSHALGVGIGPLAGVATLNLGNAISGGIGTSGVYPINTSVAADGAAVGGFAASNLNAYVANNALGSLPNALGQAFAAHTSNIYVGVSYAQVGAHALTSPAVGFGYENNMAAPTGSQGSVFGTSHFFYIRAVNDTLSPATNEHSAFVANARYDMTTGSSGRWWTTDFVAHGAIGIRPSGFSGVSSVLRNFTLVGGLSSPRGTAGGGGTPTDYDPTSSTFGQTNGTTNNASAAFYATTGFGALGTVASEVGTTTHSNATTYPLDMGFGVFGSSGTTGAWTVGYRVAYMAGGTGGNYGSSIPDLGGGVYSKIGIGFFSRDITQIGFYAYNKYPSATALGFVAAQGAGNNLFGTLVNTPSSANAGATVTVGDNFPTSTNQALTSQFLQAGGAGATQAPGTLSVYGGMLGATLNSHLRIASVGMSGNTGSLADMAILNTRFFRNSNSGGGYSTADYTTVSIGHTFDNGGAIQNGIWMTSQFAGVGQSFALVNGGNYTPQFAWDVQGTLHSTGAATFDAAATVGTTFGVTGNSTLTGLVGQGTAPVAGTGVTIGAAGGAASLNGVSATGAMTPSAAAGNVAWGQFGGNVAAANAPTNVYGVRVLGITASGGTPTNIYGIFVGAPTGGANNYGGSFGGNVGFGGNTAPAFAVDITGTLHATGAATFDGTIASAAALAAAASVTHVSLAPTYTAQNSENIVGVSVGGVLTLGATTGTTVTEVNISAMTGTATAGATGVAWKGLNVAAQPAIANWIPSDAWAGFFNAPLVGANNAVLMAKGGNSGFGTITSDRPDAVVRIGQVSASVSPFKITTFAGSSVSAATIDPTAFDPNAIVTNWDKAGRQLETQAAAPTLGNWLTGAGTTAPSTSSVSGTDKSGIITFTTTASPVGASNFIVDVTFKNPYATAPKAVIVVGANAAAAGLVMLVIPSEITTALFRIRNPAGSGFAPTTSIQLAYYVIP